MDPISVTMAVVGLLAATAKVGSLLEHLSKMRNAPQTIKDAQAEVLHTEVALRSTQRLLEHLDLANRRRGLIQVDELRVTLADAMLVFSSFEAFLMGLPGENVWAAPHRGKYLKTIEEHMVKIQRYKLSLTLMLTILQCESDAEALRNQERLQSLIERVLLDNQELKQKLRQSEDSFDACSVAMTRQSVEVATVRCREEEGKEESENASIFRRRSAVSPPFSGNTIRYAFENILQRSWVYRRNDRRHECDISFASTTQRSHTWSVFTGYSLADISVLSVIAMPITIMDVENGHYYTTKLNSDAGNAPPTAALGIEMLPKAPKQREVFKSRRRRRPTIAVDQQAFQPRTPWQADTYAFIAATLSTMSPTANANGTQSGDKRVD
ncbi:hypothetical protein B0T16DRAFT_492280 [Cercophora newfieldiana]|uniref:Fungal N-terminal domain-containing protein n=1 Tax=Cercophora newfieldiana TaxID=92897 RepID=A0AA40CSC4_9PEZI|nr:hypothetical protein B0T16DRAFT_492280 [Cercophora newfieldiana]